MNAYEAIAARHTIRSFAEREISPEILRRILSAGMQAPTNDHLRRWHFVVLQDPQKRKELLDQVIHPVNRQASIKFVDKAGMTDPDQRAMYIDAIPRQYSMLSTCAALVLPFFQQTYPLLKPESLSSLNGFASIWCCVENILIAAASEEIFGVTRIPFEKERDVIKNALHIPDGYETPCWIALGYPDANDKRHAQVKIDLDERIHLDQW